MDVIIGDEYVSLRLIENCLHMAHVHDAIKRVFQRQQRYVIYIGYSLQAKVLQNSLLATPLVYKGYTSSIGEQIGLRNPAVWSAEESVHISCCNSVVLIKELRFKCLDVLFLY